MRKGILGVMILCLLAGVGLGSALALEGPFEDGIYEGSHAFVRVEVVVKEGAVTDINILEHGGGGPYYHEMIKPLADRIVEDQSLDVDAVTGATVSSQYLKQAVRNALGL